MTDPVVRVTAEITYLAGSDQWEASAYGGGSSPRDSFELRLTRDTEDNVKAAFIDAWNQRAGTSWAPEEFGWELHELRDDPGNG
jgi:hypothetical protein